MQTNGGFRWMVLKNSLMQNMRIEFYEVIKVMG